MHHRFAESDIEHIRAQLAGHKPTCFTEICLLLICASLLIGCVPLSSPEATPIALPQPTNSSSAHTSSSSVTQITVPEPNSAKLNHIDGETVIEVHSPTGIGNAQLRIDQALPPNSLTVRFYLQGLEQLRVSTSKMSVEASVSSLDGTTVMQEVASSREEASVAVVMELIDTESPYWLEIETGTVTNRSTEDGFIDVRIPELLVSESDPTLTLAWIDFYR